MIYREFLRLKLKKARIKVMLATLLIIIGIGTLIFWEGWGREYVTYASVVTASQDIQQGEVITEKMLKECFVEKDILINGVVEYKDSKNLLNKVSKQFIAGGSQLNPNYFADEDFYLSKDKSIFKIPVSWIDTRSSSIRRGDKIEIYSPDGKSLGQYRVAFVKDEQEREVTSADSKWKETLERTDSTGVIDNIEIITTMAKYNDLKQRAALSNGEGFMIVQVFE